MKQLKRKNLISLVLVLMMTLVFSSNIVYAKEYNSQPIYTKLVIRLDVLRADPDFETLGEELIKDYLDDGWSMNEEELYLISELKEGTVFIDGERVEFSKDNPLKLPLDAKKIELDKDEYELENQKLKRSINLNKRNIGPIVLERDIFDILGEMDKSSKERLGNTHGRRFRVGDEVYCNRFNGPNTDHIHYNKRTNPVKALKNFRGSDCSVVVRYNNCCDNSDYCNRNRPYGKCSALTHGANSSPSRACNKTYHVHRQAPIYRFR